MSTRNDLHPFAGRRPAILLALAIAIVALATLAPSAPAHAGDRASWLKMYKKGLDAILAQQNDNGSFGMIPGAKEPGEVGLTALAVKAFADAPDEMKKKVADPAEEAAGYLISLQREDGAVVNDRSGLATYRSSLAIMAWVSLDAEKYKANIAKARDYLLGTQFHEGHMDVKEDNPYYGGWGYDKKGEKPDADMSNTAFALAALVAAGLDEKDPVFERAATFVSRCQNRTESNPGFGGVRVLDDGGFFYDPGLSRRHAAVRKGADGKDELVSYASITYMGLMSLLHAKVGKDDGRVKAAVGWITKHYTLDENHGLGTREDPERAQDGLYYYYYAFAKALDAFGQTEIVAADGTKRVWAADLLDALAARQRDDGTWVNTRERWWEIDPTLCTLYVLNASGVALRNLP